MSAQAETPESAATAPPRGTSFARWGPAAVAGAGLLLAGFVHRDFLTMRPRTALALPLSTDVENWFFEPSDTSPALVLAFVGWLLLRRRRRLVAAIGARGPIAFTTALFAAAFGIFFWSLRTAAPELQAFAVFFELLGVAHLLGGAAALRVVVVPAVLLVFAMPLPSPLLNEIVWKFQIWTADYTGFLLRVIGQPAFVSGDQLFLSSQVFQIIETCSGMRATETLTLLSVLMVDLFRRRGLHAALVILAAIPVAFAINGFRALGLIFNPHADIASVHNLQGIAMLLAGVLLVYGFDGLLERVLPQREAPLARRPSRGGAVPVARLGALATGLAVFAGLSLWLPRFELPLMLPVMPSSHLAHDLEGWRGSDVPSDRIFLGQTGFSHILHRRYERAGQQVDVFIGSASPVRRYRSFWSPKTALPSSGWIVEQRGSAEVQGRPVEVQVVRRGTRRLLVYHWREETFGLAAETLRSALALDASPLRRALVPLVVRIHTPIAPLKGARESAEERLRGFVESLAPALKQIATPRDSLG